MGAAEYFLSCGICPALETVWLYSPPLLTPKQNTYVLCSPLAHILLVDHLFAVILRGTVNTKSLGTEVYRELSRFDNARTGYQNNSLRVLHWR